MEARDLIVTPLLVMIIYTVAYIVRPFVTDEITRRYFFPALTVRIVGALAVGFIYQFYYHGGDTFSYHTHGSRIIWEVIMESPSEGFKALFSGGEYGPGLWKTAEKVWYWRDENSFFVVQIATIFDLFTFSSYSGTAVLFAVVSFVGGWMLFLTFYRQYPSCRQWIAFSTLFIPTVIFWGSGIFKDSLTLAALSIATYSFHRMFIKNNITIVQCIILIVAFWIIYKLKVYILLCFLPSLLFWAFAKNLSGIHSPMLKILIAPIVILISLMLGYFTVRTVTKDDSRYDVSKLAETVKVTAYDIRFGWGSRMGEGSGYTLGQLDGSWQSMLRLTPQAINASLFRPYLWEVRNPLMLLSAMEGLALFFLTAFVILRVRLDLFRYLQVPDVLFCLIFSLVFAFAVGVSTYNFGTLSRYKIPLIPFYLLGIGLIDYHWKRDRKFGVLDKTE